MKRRRFFSSMGFAAVAAAVPSMVKAQEEKAFAHSPWDYAQVQEEPEEFQELEVDFTPEQDRMDIIWE